MTRICHRVTERTEEKRKWKREKGQAPGSDDVELIYRRVPPRPVGKNTEKIENRKGQTEITTNMKLEPNPKNKCFGCGGANERGMRLTFEQDDEGRRIHGRFRIGAEYSGGPGFVHGGIIATLLDEAMGKVNRFRGLYAVTAELNVEYLRPVPVDADIVIEAREVDMKGRNLYHVGEIRNLKGDVLARGRGRFVDLTTP